MNDATYLFRFNQSVDLDDVGDSLTLALLAVRNYYGQSCPRLEDRCAFDRRHRTCAIDATSDLGTQIAQVFAGLVVPDLADGTLTLRRSNGKRSRKGKP